MTPQARAFAPTFLALAGLLSLAAAIGIGRFAFTPLLPLMVREGLMDVAQGGWMAAANYSGYLAGALTATHVPLRAGALAVWALLATAVLTAAMACQLPALWVPLRFLAGAASAWTFVATSVWCLGALADQGAARLVGWVYAGVGCGIALTGLYCLFAAAAGFRSSSLWLQLGGLALLLALSVAWVVVRLPRAPHAAAPRTGAVDSPRDDNRTTGLVICYGSMGFGYIQPATFLPVLARSVIDDPSVFGLAWPVFGATAALSTLLAAQLLRGASRLRTWAVCQLLMSLGVLLPTLWATIWAIAASALLVGGTFMVITLAGVQEMRSRSPAHAARLVGRITAAFALGQIAGPVISALLLRIGPQGLAFALGAGALSLFISGAWLWCVASSEGRRR